MKVVCIDTGVYQYITLEKVYECDETKYETYIVPTKDSINYRIVNDMELYCNYSCNLFATISEYRKMKLKKLKDIEDESNMYK